MSNKVVLIGIMYMLVIGPLFGFFSISSYNTEASGLADTPWPMFRNNLNHTGLSLYDTSDNPGRLKWKFQTGGRVFSSPAIGSDDSIYVGSDDGHVYAIYPNGTLRWKFRTGEHIDTSTNAALDDVMSSPAIDSDDTIYIGSKDDYLYAFYPNGTLKWKFLTGSDIVASPTIDNDGIIYIGSLYQDYLYAIFPNGTFKWKFPIDIALHYSAPAIDSDGTLYIGADNYLYAINSGGTLEWKYWVGAPYASPAIDSDGTLYIGSTFCYDANNSFYAIYPNGTLKWEFQTGNRIFSSAAIGSDGTIYVGSEDTYLYAIFPNGTMKWKFKTGSRIFSSPAIGSDGTIYVGSDGFYGINPNGTLRWRLQTTKDILSSPAIDSDGTIYVGSKDGCLYAIGKIPPSPPQNLLRRTGDSYVYLTWEAPSDDGGSAINQYKIYRSNSSGGESILTTIDGSIIMYNDTSVTNGQDYYYFITAINNVGESDHSNEVHATPYAITLPSAPRNVSALAGDGYVYLTWEAPDSNGNSTIVNYKIYRGTLAGGENLFATIGNELYYNDTSVINGQSYYYKVSAVNGQGEGPNSTEVNANPKLPPPDSDQDNLLDSWELQHFGNLTYSAIDDVDDDGYTNLQEYQGDTNPKDNSDYPALVGDEHVDSFFTQYLWMVIIVIILIIAFIVAVLLITRGRKKKPTEFTQTATMQPEIPQMIQSVQPPPPPYQIPPHPPSYPPRPPP